MSNFRVCPGMSVRAVETIGGLTKGEVYQILSAPTAQYPYVSLVGIKSVFTSRRFAQVVEPIPMVLIDVPATFGAPVKKSWFQRLFNE